MIGDLGGKKKELFPVYLVEIFFLFSSADLILGGCRKFLASWRLRQWSVTNSSWKGWGSYFKEM